MQCKRPRTCLSANVFVVPPGGYPCYCLPTLQPASNAILVKTPKFPFANLIKKPFQVKVRVRSGKQQQESSNHMFFTYQPPGGCDAM